MGLAAKLYCLLDVFLILWDSPIELKSPDSSSFFPLIWLNHPIFSTSHLCLIYSRLASNSPCKPAYHWIHAQCWDYRWIPPHPIFYLHFYCCENALRTVQFIEEKRLIWDLKFQMVSSLTITEGSMAVGRQEWHWRSTWELRSWDTSGNHVAFLNLKAHIQ